MNHENLVHEGISILVTIPILLATITLVVLFCKLTKPKNMNEKEAIAYTDSCLLYGMISTLVIFVTIAGVLVGVDQNNIESEIKDHYGIEIVTIKNEYREIVFKHDGEIYEGTIITKDLDKPNIFKTATEYELMYRDGDTLKKF